MVDNNDKECNESWLRSQGWRRWGVPDNPDVVVWCKDGEPPAYDRAGAVFVFSTRAALIRQTFLSNVRTEPDTVLVQRKDLPFFRKALGLDKDEEGRV